jgi:predicted nuclease of predicted toxin-antitoxin system
MRFLADVNASGSLCQWLVEMGHEVLEVRTLDARMRDEEILRLAVAEQRIILTTDRDFEEMIWREGRSHLGVLRLENLPRAARKKLLQDVLTYYGNELESGAIIIADSRKIRIRRR